MIDWNSAPGHAPTTPDEPTTPVAPTTQAPTSIPPSPDLKVQPAPATLNESPLDTLGRMLKGGSEDFAKDPGAAFAKQLSQAANPLSPFAAIGDLLGHIPLKLPGEGGVQGQFDYLGSWIKDNDPDSYEAWRTTKVAADADVLGGGNLMADFNLNATKKYDEWSKSATFGSNPYLALGAGSFGSVGGALSSALQGVLGETGIFANEVAANTGLLGQGHDRMQRIVQAYRDDPEQLTNPAELHAAQMLDAGAWNEDHAAKYLTMNGAGYSENPWVNMAATIGLDPQTWTPLIATKISKLAEAGRAIEAAASTAEGAARAQSTGGKIAMAVAEAQRGRSGDVWRFARGTIGMDPLGAFHPGPRAANAAGLIDTQAGLDVTAMRRAYGPGSFDSALNRADELGIGDEMNAALGSAAVYQGDMYFAKRAADGAVQEGLRIIESPDDYLEVARRAASSSEPDRMAEYMASNMTRVESDAERQLLANRMAAMSGKSVQEMRAVVDGMSSGERSVWHYGTFAAANREFAVAKQGVDVSKVAEDFPMSQMVLANETTFDTVARNDLVAALRDTKGYTLQERNAIYNAAVTRHKELGHLGYVPEIGGESQLAELADYIEMHPAMRTADPSELAAMPTVVDMLGRHVDEAGQPLWKVGFRPGTDDAWGLRDNPITGQLEIGHQPMVSWKVDPSIPVEAFRDVARNSLGQILPHSKLSKPVESMAGMFEAGKDIVSGRRLFYNWKQSFGVEMEKLGVPKAVGDDIFQRLMEASGARATTLRGVSREDARVVLKSIADEGRAVTKEGIPMTENDLILAVAEATKGDMRLFGAGTTLTQRMRKMMVRSGDEANKIGDLTTTQYLNFRYRLNPMFGAQRALEGVYYSVVHGVQPVLRRELPEHLRDTALLMHNLGNTTIGRDFAMDIPEWATRSNLSGGVPREMAKLAGSPGKWTRFIHNVMTASDVMVRNNMVNMFHHRAGLLAREIMRDADSIRSIVGDIDGIPENAALLEKSFDDWAKHFSELEGRVLSENEVGIKYLQSLFSSGRRMKVVDATGKITSRTTGAEIVRGLDTKGLIHESSWMTPDSIGDIGTIYPDGIAQELGFADAAELRAAMKTHINPATGARVNKYDMASLREGLKALDAHPDVIKRAEAYFGGTWDEFWDDLARPEGMDISERAARPAKELIQNLAKERGMDPWEYLSGIVGHTVKGKDLKTTMGEFAKFLQGNPKTAPLRVWIKHFNDTALQASGSRKLIEEYQKAVPDLIKQAKAAGDTAEVERLTAIQKALPGPENALKAAGDEAIPAVPAAPAMEEIPHDLKVVARATVDATQPVKAGQKPIEVYHYVVSPKEGAGEQLSSQTYATAQEAIDAGQARAQELATASRKALGEPTHREASLAGREATRPVTVPEGYTANPNEVAGAGGHSFDPRLKREGFYHVTVQKDAFKAGAAHPGEPAAGIEGFGSKGDTANAGRTSLLMDKESSLNYQRRITLAVDAAQGRASVPDIVAEFKPVYEEAYGDKAVSYMEKIMGGMKEDEWAAKVVTPEQRYRMVQALDNNLVGAPIAPQKAAAHLTTPFESAVKIDRNQIAMVKFGAKKGAGVNRGLDKFTGEVTIPHGDLTTLEVTPLADDATKAAAAKAAKAQAEADRKAFEEVIGEEYEKWFADEIVKRVKSGKPHANGDIEAIARGLAQWTKEALGAARVQGTRRIMRDLVDQIPTEGAATYSRTEATIMEVARTKIQELERDVFRLAEMQTERSSFARQFNHPLFGVYPSSYMWGKVFPESLKFLARSPYGVTYDIAKVQMLIAAQREMNPEFEDDMAGIDRSAVAFLLGYLTPSLPWEAQEARVSPFFRTLLEEGVNIDSITQATKNQLKTMAPERFFTDVPQSIDEIVTSGKEAVETGLQNVGILPKTEQELQSETSTAEPVAPTPTPPAKGTITGTELAPVLSDSMQELMDALR